MNTYDNPQEFIRHFSNILVLVPILIRFLLTATFLTSFFLQPLQHPIMVLWARVVESDKPVFTLLFAGAASVAKIIQEIINSVVITYTRF
jgi:hypothetical protein